MAAYGWQIPLAIDHSCQCNHHWPNIPTPPWRKNSTVRLSAFMQSQYDLSRPGGGPDPYAHPDSDDIKSTLVWIPKFHFNAAVNFWKGAAITIRVSKSIFSALTYYVLLSPMRSLCSLFRCIDWWILFALLVAITISPVSVQQEAVQHDKILEYEKVVEYELVKDIRRWGMFKNAYDD